MSVTAANAIPGKGIASPGVGRRPWPALVAVLLVAGPLAVSVFAPDPTGIDLANRLAPPSADAWLGTDHLGRDVLNRLVHGARLSLGLAGVAVIITAVIGLALGIAAARLGGVLEQVVVAAVDLLISLPRVLMALFIAAVLAPGITALLIALVVTGWTTFARLSFGMTRSLSQRDFVKAAVALGGNDLHIARHHLVPNLAGPLGALLCLEFSLTLLSVAGLSFLGIGAQPPAAEWGLMLAGAQPYMERVPLLVLAPAAAIVLAGLAVTAVGRNLQSPIHSTNH